MLGIWASSLGVLAYSGAFSVYFSESDAKFRNDCDNMTDGLDKADVCALSGPSFIIFVVLISVPYIVICMLFLC